MNKKLHKVAQAIKEIIEEHNISWKILRNLRFCKASEEYNNIPHLKEEDIITISAGLIRKGLIK